MWCQTSYLNSIQEWTRTDWSLSLISGNFYFLRVIGGMLFVSCGGSHRVLVYDCNTLQLIRSFGKKGKGNGEFKWPVR